jgi:2,4-dienoyl-CoA reductase-like NADH-dependent reductase (Old Yellow Enzyme family)
MRRGSTSVREERGLAHRRSINAQLRAPGGVLSGGTYRLLASVQAADLLRCHTAALAGPMRAPKPSTKPPWSLRERLDEHEIAKLITAYHNGATTASLATARGVSLSSVKRLLRNAGIRRAPSTRGSAKARPTAT